MESAHRFDAVTDVALQLRAAMATATGGDVYARYVDGDTSSEVLPVTEFEPRSGGGPLVVHASPEHGGGVDVDRLEFLDRPILLLVHDTLWSFPAVRGGPPPARLFDLASRVVASSSRAASWLRWAGFDDVPVVAPPLPRWSLFDAQPHAPTLDHLDSMADGPVLLYVGDVVRGSRIERLIAAYHALVTSCIPHASLIIVGPTSDSAYTESLARFIRDLNLPNAWIAGDVAADVAAAFWRRASILITQGDAIRASATATIEATASKIPIAVLGEGRLSAAVGEVGFQIPADESIEVVAEALSEIARNDDIRGRFIARGEMLAGDPRRSRPIRRYLELLTELI